MRHEFPSSKSIIAGSQRSTLQLKLIHLVVMVTMVAVAFGMRRWAMEMSAGNGLTVDAPFWREVVLITFSILDGLLLTATSVLIVEAVRGNVKQLHPGYVFLAVGVLILFVELSSTLVFSLLEDGITLAKASMLVWLICFVLQSLVLMVGMFFDRWWWRVTSAVLVVGVLMRIFPLAYSLLDLYGWLNSGLWVYEVTNLIFNIAIGLAAIAILSSMVVDGVKKQQRDWPHWVGCVLLFLTPIAYVVISAVVSRYLPAEEMF